MSTQIRNTASAPRLRVFMTTWRVVAATALLLSFSSPAPSFAANSENSGALFHYSQASFNRITVEQGLSANTVRGIVQDEKGFIWIGTQDGLNRYDGYDFKVYRHDPDDPDSLSANGIYALAALNGRIWVATEHGLDSLDIESGRITRHVLPGNAAGKAVNIVAAGKDNVLWIGTPAGAYRLASNGNGEISAVSDTWQPSISAITGIDRGALIGTEDGLYRYDEASNEISALLVPDEALSVDRIWIDRADKSRSSSIWVAGSHGLWHIDHDGKVLAHYTHDPVDPGSLSANQVNSVIRDSDGTLWAGTRNGLDKLDEVNERFQHFYNVPSDPASLSSSIVNELFEDRSGLLWVGGYYGLNVMRQRGFEFGLLNHHPDGLHSLLDENVFAISQDEQGRYWVGSAGGITVINPQTGEFHGLPSLPGTAGRPPYVISLEHDRDGTMWAGTVFYGLYRIDPVSLAATRVPLPQEKNLQPPFVTHVLQDANGRTWAAHHELFLKRDAESGWQRFPIKFSEEAQRHAMHLAFGNDGALWVGSHDGLARISLADDPADDSVTWFRSGIPEGTGGLKRTDILSLLVDEQDRLWFGSDGAGLGMLENSSTVTPAEAGFRYLNRSDGMLNDTVYAILADRQGDLWFSTNRGITKIDSDTLHMRHFGPGQGLQGLEFNESSAYKDADGLMFFGGPMGVSFFNPESLQPSEEGPPVRITGLTVAGKRQALPEDGVLNLGYKDYIFTIRFVALNYANPEASRYEYRLKGFSDDWIRLQDSHEATFTNLDAGKYLLEVRAAATDGVWTQVPARLHVEVAPAPWQTAWAYATYMIAFLLLLYLAVYLRVRKHRLETLHERENSERLERLVNERTRELAQKSRALEEASVTDMLTRLHNRRYVYTRIEQDLAMVRRRHADKKSADDDRKDLLFVMIDIDHFKQINDKYGHFSGDQVLIAVAHAIKESCRSSDTVVRWGGEEFLAVALDSDRNMATRVAGRLHNALDNLEVEIEGGKRVRITCSIGICPYPFDPRDWNTLGWERILGLADRAMYAVKRFGRNGWMVVDHDPAKPPVTAEILRTTSLDIHASNGNVRISTSLAQIQLRWRPDDPPEDQ